MPKATISVPASPRTGPNAPRTRHGRNRAVVVENWPLIAERRALGFQLVDVWRELTEDPAVATITYKAFRKHVHEVAEAKARMTTNGPAPTPPAAPRGAEVEAAGPGVEAPAPRVGVSQKEKFRLARERRLQEEAEAAAAPPKPAGKPDMSMIDGGEVWMSILGRVRVRELAALNLKLQAGEVDEAEARPVLEAARREAWSKHLGIRADQLTEEEMNGHW